MNQNRMRLIRIVFLSIVIHMITPSILEISKLYSCL